MSSTITTMNDPLQNILDAAGKMFDDLVGYIDALFSKNREMWARRIKTVEDVLRYLYETCVALRTRLISAGAGKAN